MENEVLPYIEMCQREACSLQRGMNFDLGKGYSVLLMSVRSNAPYRDRLEDDGSTLIYEGHDSPKSEALRNPKAVDQPERTKSGLTENGKFLRSAVDFKCGSLPPRIVRVYEKIHPGIWSYNGTFHLIDAWREQDHARSVFKFKLITSEAELLPKAANLQKERRRIIPSSVKREVWERDEGKCVICGAKDELHFDHVLPYSRGGTSVIVENVQLLCARHNLSKGAKIL